MGVLTLYIKYSDLITLKQHLVNIKVTLNSQLFVYQMITNVKFNIGNINNYLILILQLAKLKD